MYLSRLILNPRSRNVQRDLADPYELHRTVLRGFPTGEVKVVRNAADAAGVLYRVDPHPQSKLPILLVQSQIAPDWSFLQAETFQSYLIAPGADHEEPNPAVKERNLTLQAGQTLAFRLRANPTKRLSAGKGHTGKRVGIYAETEQRAWLTNKAQQSGFRILRAEISQGDKVQWRALRQVERQQLAEKHDAVTTEKRPAKPGLLEVQFDGILQVTDVDCFLAALAAGIGSGKAFGFGLLSLAPVQ